MPLRVLASASPKLEACLNFSRRLAGMVICYEILKFHSIAFLLRLDIRRRNFSFKFGKSLRGAILFATLRSNVDLLK